MNNFDIFKPKKRYNIIFSYENENKNHLLQIDAHDKEFARNMFLQDINSRKYRKLKKYDISQEAWSQ